MIRKWIPVVVALVALAGAVEAAEAQQRPRPPAATERERDTTRSSNAAIPRQYMPPPGMCRIWLKDVPPAQQPAPTDCATAIRKRPSNGRVVFGERRGEERDGMNLRRELRPRPTAPAPTIPPLLGVRLPGRNR